MSSNQYANSRQNPRPIWRLASLVVLTLIAGATGCNSSDVSPSTAKATRPTTAPTTVRLPATAAPVHRAPSSPPPPTGGGAVINSAGAILPNSSRTPGAVNPNVTQANIASTICIPGWTATVRPSSAYTTSLKKQQLATGYAYGGDTNTGDYEEDHLIPLELGGSPASALNLWPEPFNASDGAVTKDRIENKLKTLVCDGAVSLTVAQHAIATNWFVAYQTYLGAPASTTAPPAPSTHSVTLTCSARVSSSSPTDYSTVDVMVDTGLSGATVTATAHYKSTDTTHTGTAAGNGVATIPFHIARATVGYQVGVAVTVSGAGSTSACSTAFTPR